MWPQEYSNIGTDRLFFLGGGRWMSSGGRWISGGGRWISGGERMGWSEIEVFQVKGDGVGCARMTRIAVLNFSTL